VLSFLWRSCGLAALVLSLLLGGKTILAQQVLQHHVRPAVTQGKAALVGQMPTDQQLHLSIVLPLRDPAGLTALLSRLYDPSSPDYRKFLTVQQFTDQFGPSAEDYAQVVAFAKANGFTVTDTPANRLIVPIRGSVAQINQAFNVQMNVYQHPTEKRTFFSPDREPSLNLSVPVSAIAGMDSYSLPRPLSSRLPSGAQPLAVNGSGPGGSYLGSDMRAAYYGGSTLTGLGQTVGLLEFGGYFLSDVNLTFSNAGQSYSVPINNVLIDDATGAPNVDDGEQVLDIVQAIGMAPGLSQVRVYIGSTDELDDANVLNKMVSEDIAQQLSNSWAWQPADPTTDDVFFEEMAAQGQSFFVASGDLGAYDAAISPFFYPAEDANVTAVGGTSLTTAAAGGSWASEVAWNFPPDGSGGGISPDNIAIPGWQSGVANSANGGSATIRNIPDVAAEGNFDNYSCDLGECSGDWGGTSFAAPRWAAFMALVNQQAVEAGNAPNGGVGFLNPPLYLLAEGANYGTDLHDIVSGNNETDYQPVYFNAVTGYDLVTGWGSPAGQSLINDLAGPAVPGFFLSPAQPTVALNPGGNASVNLTITDVGGFTGSVNFAVTSTLPSGVTAAFSPNPSTGTTALTLTATSNAATTTASVTVTGTSGMITGSTTLTLNVHPPAFGLTAAPNFLGINQGASGSATVSVVPQYGFTGSVSLSVSGLPTGVTASLSPVSTTGTSTLTFNVSNSAVAGTSPITINGTSGDLNASTTLSLSIEAPSFSLTNYGTVSLGQGSTATTTIYVADLYGFTGNVTLAASGLPSGVTASFSPNPTTGSAIMTLVATSSATLGQSMVTVTGTSGPLTATTTVALGVYAPSFTLGSSSSVSIGQGSSGSSYVDVIPQYGFSGNVSLSVSGLPAGVTALFSPNPTNEYSSLSLAASSTAPVGQYTVTIKGVSGSLSATTTLTLGIYAPSFTVGTYSTVTLGQGTSSTTYVYVTPQYGFSGSVNLSIANLPAGVTGSFSPNPTTGYSSLTLQASASASLGQYTATITGTSGNQTASTPISIGVFTPTFTLSNSGSIAIGQGTSTTEYLYIDSQYGFAGNVNFTVSGLPAGVTASFSPNPSSYSTILTLTASGTAAVGASNLTITGTSGGQTATTVVSLGVYTPTFTLYDYGNVTLGQGGSNTTPVFINPLYGFSGNVSLSVSGLPTGVTASFTSNGTGGSTLALTASSTAAVGSYNLTITGTSGTQTATAQITLSVYAPSFTIGSYGGILLGQGSSGATTIYVSDQYGFSGNVTLSVSGLPSGVTASFSLNPTTQSSLLTLTASSSASVGSTTLTITGVSGSETQTTTIPLSIYAPTFTLSGPYNISMNEGTSTSQSINVYDQYGFTGAVTLTLSGLPSGVTATVSPNSTTSNSVLTLSASNNATPGQTTVTLTGTSGAITVSTSFLLTINSPSFALTAAPSRIAVMPGTAATSTISVVPANNFTGSVTLAASGLPSGVTAAFSPSAATTDSVLTLTASSTAVAGITPITITGTSGGESSSIPVNLVVLGAASTTSTTLALTASGTAATSVSAGTMVTATATVAAGSTPLTVGLVNFCDATATTCDPLHQIGSAQLTSAGTAVLRFIPGPGSRSFKAIFAGTTADASSTSAVSSLTITAAQPTTTTIAKSGSAGNYTLTGTVTGEGPFAPSGNLSFLDTSADNNSLGQPALVAGTPVVSFANSQSPNVGSQPQWTATGDFNGDGIPDLAVANEDGTTVSILLGNGDGTFTATSGGLAIGSTPSFVAAGDFNGDGKADLAVLSFSAGSVSIFLGNGDGTFTASPLSPQSGGSPNAMVVADFNGDGIEDLAITNQYSGTVTVQLGNGDGTFTPASSMFVGNSPQALVTADFNGDGIPDLAVPNSYAGTVSILLGNGDGTFTIASTPAAGNSPSAIAAADVNGDGKPDLIVVTGSYFAAGATVLLGNGDGTFTAGTTLGTSTNSGGVPSLAVADFNRDGKVDVVLGNYYNSSVSLYLGNGDGTFGSASSTGTGIYPTAIATGDWNGDGIPDLAVANSESNTLTILTLSLAQTATATITGVSPLGQGQHIVEASYPGDGTFRSSVSPTTTLAGADGTPAVSLVLSAPTINTLQPLTVTVSVGDGTGAPAATGSVVLTSGSYTSAAVTLHGGSAAITLPAGSLPAGADTLSAAYTPDTAGSLIYNAATGTGSVTVTKVTPIASVTLSASSIDVAQSLTASIAVSGGTGDPTPTGSVVLSSGSYTSASTALASGSASIVLPANSLAVGSDSIHVAYTPDPASTPIYNAATGAASVTVAALGSAAPTLTVTPSATAITNLQTETIAVAVAGVSGQPTPTGTVTLSSGSYSAQLALASGAASFTIPAGTLANGADTLTAAYSGDTVYASASNNSVVVTVEQVVPTATSIAALSPGANATSTVTLTAGSNYSGTMNLSCALTASPTGAQSLPTCSLSASSLALTAGGNATATLTVATTAGSTAALDLRDGLRRRLFGFGGSLAAVLVLCWLPSKRRRLPGLLIALAFALLTLGISGCGGGGGGSSSPPPTSTPATTAGSYTFTVTAADSTSSVKATTNVTFTVQ